MRRILFLTILILSAKVNAQQTSQKDINRFLRKTKAPVSLISLNGQDSASERKYEVSAHLIYFEKQRKAYPSYLNRFEVRVSDYMNFCRQQSDDSLYPDSMIFYESNSLGEVFMEPYFWHPVYSNNPIVGITYSNCIAYCKWLEDSLRNESIRIFGKDIIKKVTLPTRGQWLAAAADKDAEIFAANYIRKGLRGRHKDHDNFAGLNTGSIKTANGLWIAGKRKDGYEFTNPVNKVERNKKRFYNLLGNVAEYVQDTIRLYHQNEFESGKSSYKYSDTSLYKSRLKADSIFGNTLPDDFMLNRFNSQIRYPSSAKGLTLLNTYNNHAIIAGASWKDDLVFIHTRSIRVVEKNDRKSYAGFRFVVEFK